MHVESNVPREPGARQRLRIAAGLILILANLAGIARAADFDEKVRAPLMKDAGSMRTQAQSYSARFADLKDAGAAQLISNRALANEQFDLVWQLQQAIDVHRPLGDMSSLGLVNRGDGSYSIDLIAFPQWDRVDMELSTMLPQLNWEAFSQQLIARGMEPGEATKLKEYTATHNVEIAKRTELLPVSLSFSKLVKKFDRVKRPIADSVVLSYVYQRAHVASEVTREWAAGLLQSIEAKSARILLSAVREGQASTIWAPSDQSAGIADILSTVRLPNFEQLATSQAQGETP